MAKSTVNKTAGKLFVLALAMFGFGYLLVPLYNVFCDIAGINGKTGVTTVQQAEAQEADQDRLVTIEFDTNIRELPWDFRPLERKVKVHPGEVGEATFMVRNNSDKAIIGRAIPSVAPSQAAVYFNKTECFCFTEQRLEAGESMEMKVRFIVDTDLPSRFGALVLSYTFFQVPQAKEAASKGLDKVGEINS